MHLHYTQSALSHYRSLVHFIWTYCFSIQETPGAHLVVDPLLWQTTRQPHQFAAFVRELKEFPLASSRPSSHLEKDLPHRWQLGHQIPFASFRCDGAPKCQWRSMKAAEVQWQAPM